MSVPTNIINYETEEVIISISKKRITLGSNKEKLWADILKLLYEKKVKPDRFSNFSHIIQEAKNKSGNV